MVNANKTSSRPWKPGNLLRANWSATLRASLCVGTVWASSLQLGAQVDERGVDTTTTGYQIGYQVGSWLPFIVVVIIALVIVASSYRFPKSKK